MTLLDTRPVTDAELLTSAVDGDESAFAALVAPHRGALTAHCARLLRSGPQADDAVQDALLRAWRRLGSFERRSSFGWWLRTIATNVCIEHIRRRDRDRAVVHAVAEEHTRSCSAAARHADLAEAMAGREEVEAAYVRALRTLPERQCAVLVLRSVLRFSAAETAALLDCTVAAVNSALQRANAGLAARRLADTGVHDPPATPAERRLARELVEAHERADAEAVVATLLASV